MVAEVANGTASLTSGGASVQVPSTAPTAAGTYVLTLDTSGMGDDDVLNVKVYAKDSSVAASYRLWKEFTLVRPDPVIQSIPVAAMGGAYAVLEHPSGTTSPLSVPWALLTL